MQRFWLSTISLLVAGPFAPALMAQAANTPVTVQLEPIGNSGIKGTAVLTAKEQETDFLLTITATDAARQQKKFDVILRQGTCGTPGKKVTEVGDLRANGEAEHEDEDVVLRDLGRADHILQVRDEKGGDVVACGAIPRAS